MSEEIDKLKAENADLVAKNEELERQLASLQAKPQQQIQNATKREIWDILKFLRDSSAAMTVGQIAGHFGLRPSIAEHHLAVLGSKNLIMQGQPSFAMLRMTGTAENTWRISPNGTHLLLMAPESA